MPLIPIADIELDVSTLCRAKLSRAVVSMYADLMTTGTVFDPIVLFGSGNQWWIGDGWHRIKSATKIGALTIDAELYEGGRVEALKYALKANDKHGHRRTNEDKRRCVEIALAEFTTLSSRQIAELCGVSHTFVDAVKPQVATVATSTVTGADGKRYPVLRSKKPKGESREPTEQHTTQKARPVAPPSNGMRYANLAIYNLREIEPNDTLRAEGFAHVARWLQENLHTGAVAVCDNKLPVVRFSSVQPSAQTEKKSV